MPASSAVGATMGPSRPGHLASSVEEWCPIPGPDSTRMSEVSIRWVVPAGVSKNSAGASTGDEDAAGDAEIDHHEGQQHPPGALPDRPGATIFEHPVGTPQRPDTPNKQDRGWARGRGGSCPGRCSPSSGRSRSRHRPWPRRSRRSPRRQCGADHRADVEHGPPKFCRVPPSFIDVVGHHSPSL